MDLKGKTIVAKNYRGLIRLSLQLLLILKMPCCTFFLLLSCFFVSRAASVSIIGDIPMNAAERFSLYIQEKEELELRPVFTIDGITFVYVKV